MLADGIAALRAPLIRVQLSREAAFCLGALAVDPPAREVARDGIRETLEPRVMQVLVLLARHRGRVVSREDLIEACWDGRIVSENAVNRVLSVNRRRTGTPDRRPKGTPLWRWRASMVGAPFALVAA